MMTIQTALDTKYGYIMRTSPHDSGTIAFCFLPYMKKPSPIVLNRKPQASKVMSIAVFGFRSGNVLVRL